MPADLTKYRRESDRQAAPEPAPAKPKGKQPYEAYRLSKEAKRHLEIRVKFPDPAECPLNSMITNIRGEWRRGLGVTLVYGKTMIVEVKGKRLQEFFQAAKDWKVEWIEVFDERFHLPPTEEDAPMITSLEIFTEKPEPLPPMSERH